MQENTVFSVLNALNCNEHVEKKGNLSYLSWAWAWQMVTIQGLEHIEYLPTIPNNPSYISRRTSMRQFFVSISDCYKRL